MDGLGNLALVFIFFGLGYISKRLFQAPGQVSLNLNRYVINLALPAVILRVVPSLDLQAGTFFMVLAPWLALGISALAVMALRHIYQWDKHTFCAALILAALGNTGFLGFPLIQTFFTQEQLGAAIIYDQFGSFIGLCTYATVLVAVFSGGQQIRPVPILKRILFFPPFVTLIIALVLPAGLLAGPMPGILSVVGWTITPCAMLSIGLQFNFRTQPELWLPMAAILSLKMLLAPLVILLAGLVLGVHEWMLDIAIFQAAAPPMVTPAVILIASGIAPKYAAATLGFGTLIALVYLPLLATLLNAL